MVALGRRAAIYSRISRDAEGEGVGVARQEQACRELAERRGLEVVAVFSDNDLGASDRTHKSKVRKQFAALMESAERRDFDVVVAYSNSRLTRRMSELELLIQLHESSGVEFMTVVSGQDDLSTADGRMVARIKASVDAAESDRISERQKAKFRQKALAGQVKRQRQRPFGWEDNHITVRESEAALIREGVRDLARGLSIETIRQRWMERGIKTASGGTDWSWTTTRRVLLGWRAVGVRTYRKEALRDESGEFIRGEWDAIITMEERDAALAQTNKRRLVKRRHGKYLLASLVRCGECGGRMYGAAENDRKPRTYICKDGKGHVAISADRLEDVVLSETYAHVVNRQLRGDEAAVEVVKEAWAGEQRLAEVGRSIDELMNAFSAGQLSGAVVFPQVEKLEAERNALRRDRERHEALTIETPRRIHSADDVLEFVRAGEAREFADRQADLRSEVEAVVVSKGVRGKASQGVDAVRSRVQVVFR